MTAIHQELNLFPAVSEGICKRLTECMPGFDSQSLNVLVRV